MTGVVILAAGSSSRLGKPKQNLVYQGRTLLQKAVETAVASVCKPIIVVLGANAENIKPTIQKKEITILYNADWAEGMASSVRCGIEELKKSSPDVSSVILMLCDQPFADTGLLNAMVEKQLKLSPGIVACGYNDTIGVPVLFENKYFDELLLLKGQEGAKKLLLKYKGLVSSIPFALGSVDIDTVEDHDYFKTLTTGESFERYNAG